MNVVDMNSIVMIDIENEDEVIRVQEKSGISLYELAEKYYKSKDGLKAIFARKRFTLSYRQAVYGKIHYIERKTCKAYISAYGIFYISYGCEPHFA